MACHSYFISCEIKRASSCNDIDHILRSSSLNIIHKHAPNTLNNISILIIYILLNPSRTLAECTNNQDQSILRAISRTLTISNIFLSFSGNDCLKSLVDQQSNRIIPLRSKLT